MQVGLGSALGLGYMFSISQATATCFRTHKPLLTLQGGQAMDDV
jgi:hypothetical protein